MLGHRYTSYNGAMVTTAAFVPVATGTNIKTMLQIAAPSTRKLWILEWGFTLQTSPSAASKVELIDTDVAATTGTAHVAAGVQPVDPDLPPSLVTLGTGATGYTFTAEGAITATRLLDPVHMRANTTEPQLQYSKAWSPLTAPCIDTSRFVRVRVHMGSDVNMECWIKWGE